MSWLDFLILTLATFRVAFMFVEERGPLHIFQRIRELAGISHTEDGDPEVPLNGKFLTELLSCVFCFSIWVGTFWAVLYILLPTIAPLIALPFALSAGAIIVSKKL